MSAQEKPQRVFVRVIGFSDVERHALNSMFRLSEDHAVSYALWTPEAPEPARIALLDGESYEAPLALASSGLEDVQLAWVGAVAPGNAWRRFSRPIAWPEVLQAMDELFAPPPELDFDLDVHAEDTGPDTQPPEPEAPRRRALIACASREDRLYLRARLALADLTQADEAETAAQVLELLRANRYTVSLVDFGLPGHDAWDLLREVAQSGEAAGSLIVIKARPSWPDRLRARRQGVRALFDKPPPPTDLHQLLLKL